MNAVISRVDALDILRTDHRRILELFRDFEDADMAAKKRIAVRALEELDAHAAVEERVFYPVVARKIRGAREIVLEGAQAHHVAKILLMELEALPFGETYLAKFRQLALGVTAHIEEEEELLLPLIEVSPLDRAMLGGEMAEFKRAYFERGAGAVRGAAGAGLLVVALAAAGYAAYAAVFSERKAERSMTTAV